MKGIDDLKCLSLYLYPTNPHTFEYTNLLYQVLDWQQAGHEFLVNALVEDKVKETNPNFAQLSQLSFSPSFDLDRAFLLDFRKSFPDLVFIVGIDARIWVYKGIPPTSFNFKGANITVSTVKPPVFSVYFYYHNNRQLKHPPNFLIQALKKRFHGSEIIDSVYNHRPNYYCFEIVVKNLDSRSATKYLYDVISTPNISFVLNPQSRKAVNDAKFYQLKFQPFNKATKEMMVTLLPYFPPEYPPIMTADGRVIFRDVEDFAPSTLTSFEVNGRRFSDITLVPYDFTAPVFYEFDDYPISLDTLCIYDFQLCKKWVESRITVLKRANRDSPAFSKFLNCLAQTDTIKAIKHRQYTTPSGSVSLALSSITNTFESKESLLSWLHTAPKPVSYKQFHYVPSTHSLWNVLSYLSGPFLLNFCHYKRRGNHYKKELKASNAVLCDNRLTHMLLTMALCLSLTC
ncbi:hypothetical protein GEMRC1_010636 [Eukaryota sp. GEM-RC1]